MAREQHRTESNRSNAVHVRPLQRRECLPGSPKSAIFAWTINAPDTMRRLIDLGVDGLITDYPDRLLKILQRLPEKEGQ